MANIAVKRDANKYAKALLDLAKEKKVEDVVYKNMDELHQFFYSLLLDKQKSKVFGSLLKAKQIKIVTEILDNLKIHSLVKNIVLLLIHNNKAAVLDEILFNWVEIRELYNGKIKVEVVSVIPLSDTQRETIINNLKNHIGSNFYMSNKVDKTILGGLVFYIDNKMYDDSLKGKISKIKSNI